MRRVCWRMEGGMNVADQAVEIEKDHEDENRR
jgi:hypothetical protein